MSKIEQIKEAIKNAANLESKLNDAIEPLKVGGFTSVRIRHLLNNLGAISENYFEIGSHIGCSLVSTRFGNANLKSAIGCDNFSEFQNDGRTRKEFFDNCDKCIPNQYVLFEKDCFRITKGELPSVDLYLYDGGHDYESQKQGVVYHSQFMGDEYIMCVDDFAWEAPKRGTYDGIKEAGLTILYEQVMFDGIESATWWNGFGVFLLKK